MLRCSRNKGAFEKLITLIPGERSPEARRQAGVHNSHRSLILQLPVLLLLELGDHLTTISTIAFRQTCKTIRGLLRLGSGIFPLNEFDPEILALETGFLRRSYQLPWRAQQLQSRIWCSVCRTRHPSYYFTPEQRCNRAIARRCNKVKLCDHRSFTHDEIISMPTTHMTTLTTIPVATTNTVFTHTTTTHTEDYWTRATCQDPSHRSYAVPIPFGIPMIVSEWPRDTRTYRIVSVYPLVIGQKATQAKIKMALQDLDVSLCSHTRLNNETVLELAWDLLEVRSGITSTICFQCCVMEASGFRCPCAVEIRNVPAPDSDQMYMVAVRSCFHKEPGTIERLPVTD
ncbi:hypothetical protein BU16DRAFT_255126 [Lophium mytilinum]|uniref:F-box domain-containing protein n=1 Tax=Lophium mytilinum TaxID=390894 RepID=A0A6A6R7Y5_9PEZI|nr:hypothetical protein BU16DRAFT_255126 [Lophium mytilinum]